MNSRRAFLQFALGAAGGAVLGCGGLAWGDEKPAGWVKSSKNPMLSLGKQGDFDSQNIMSPSIIKHAGKYFLFYSGGPSGPANGGSLDRYQLGLALSDDGETWQKTGKPLLPLGERDNFHVTPALLRTPDGNLAKSDDRWQMVYCGNRADDVEHATSRDGIHWKKDARSPVYRKAYSPNLVQRAGEVWMYYIHKPTAGKNGKKRPWEVHLATGRDLFSLKPHRANPVLSITQPWERGALFYPYVLREGKMWVMFYASYWSVRGVKGTRTAIGMATSDDGIHWSKLKDNPVLTPTPDSKFDSRYTSSQSILRDGDHYKLYYGARIDMIHKYYAIGMATHAGPLVVATSGTR